MLRLFLLPILFSVPARRRAMLARWAQMTTQAVAAMMSQVDPLAPVEVQGEPTAARWSPRTRNG